MYHKEQRTILEMVNGENIAGNVTAKTVINVCVLFVAPFTAAESH